MLDRILRISFLEAKIERLSLCQSTGKQIRLEPRQIGSVIANADSKFHWLEISFPQVREDSLEQRSVKYDLGLLGLIQPFQTNLATFLGEPDPPAFGRRFVKRHILGSLSVKRNPNFKAKTV